MENEKLTSEILEQTDRNQKCDYDCGFSSGFLFPDTPITKAFSTNTWYSFGHSEGSKLAKKDRLIRLLRM